MMLFRQTGICLLLLLAAIGDANCVIKLIVPGTIFIQPGINLKKNLM